jgi:peptidoglycan/xylan/chitin deacetylase (PgdA/CDA1 family)
VNRVFFERLARDPLLDLRAIVVDDFARPRASLLSRLARGMRKEGWAWLWFKAISRGDALARRAWMAVFERLHPPACDESYSSLSAATGVPVHRVPDIHADASLALIRGLRPQLGAIVGGRILQDAVVTIPEHGTLNIHKRRVPDYRGGGPVGYWEVLAGEASIGVTIHYARPQVDTGDVVAEASIPIEECDTLASLRIKADLRGAQLYHDAIRAVARGERQGRPQDLQRGRTFKAPSELSVWRLERQLRQRARQRMPSLRGRPALWVRARLLLQYALLSPLLLATRRRLARQRRAPVCILFYHLVANRPLNHMCLPLEDFVRQLEFLRRHSRLVSLEGAAMRDAEGSRSPAVAVTFDDGYRDNVWAVEYLSYFGIPATFFVSVGHVLAGSAFEHDRQRAFTDAQPMRQADVRELVERGFEVGSHGLFHEDFGTLDREAAARVLADSRRLLGEITGQPPERFSFPKGRWGVHITPESLALAGRHYRHLYSAYGGYNFPEPGRRHYLRHANPGDLLELAMILDGYTGFRECLSGNAWGLKTTAPAPTGATPQMLAG